jgi:hypothetical protein
MKIELIKINLILIYEFFSKMCEKFKILKYKVK